MLNTFLSLGTYLCLFWRIFVFRKITKVNQMMQLMMCYVTHRIFFGAACELISQI